MISEIVLSIILLRVTFGPMDLIVGDLLLIGLFTDLMLILGLIWLIPVIGGLI